TPLSWCTRSRCLLRRLGPSTRIFGPMFRGGFRGCLHGAPHKAASPTEIRDAPRNSLCFVHLLNLTVGAHQQGGRYVEAERLSGFEIEDGFVLGRRLHGEIGRLASAHDAMAIAR